jgi:hypothetical protein
MAEHVPVMVIAIVLAVGFPVAVEMLASLRRRRPAIGRRRMLLVVDPWHLPRARLALRACGLPIRGTGCRAAVAERPRRTGRVVLAHEPLGFDFCLLRRLVSMPGGGGGVHRRCRD